MVNCDASRKYVSSKLLKLENGQTSICSGYQEFIRAKKVQLWILTNCSAGTLTSCTWGRGDDSGMRRMALS